MATYQSIAEAGTGAPDCNMDIFKHSIEACSNRDNCLCFPLAAGYFDLFGDQTAWLSASIHNLLVSIIESLLFQGDKMLNYE